MKIAVCISCVPDTTSKINFTENNTEFNKEGIQFIINPNDEFGLTKAIFIKEQNQAEVIVVSIGESSIEPVLRKALAIGADSAVRIDDKAKDSICVAKNLSAYLAENKFDLIIMGKESADYNGGVVHGIVAENIGMQFVNACVSLEISDDSYIIERETEGGTEKMRIKSPAIIAGQKGLVEEKDLKIPNMRGIMQARTKPLNVLKSESFDFIQSIEFIKPTKNKECISTFVYCQDDRPDIKYNDVYSEIVKNITKNVGIYNNILYDYTYWTQMYEKNMRHKPHNHAKLDPNFVDIISWVHFIDVPNQKCFRFLDNDGNFFVPNEQSNGDIICFPSISMRT